MKTKMLALILMAGGSMFAQSRFQAGIALEKTAPACQETFQSAGFWSHDIYGRSIYIGRRDDRSYDRYDRRHIVTRRFDRDDRGRDRGYFRDGDSRR